MTDQGMPETIVEIKKWLQKQISQNARTIDRNDQVRRFNSGETKWEPSKKGLCNWLKVSTDAKRHVMIWTIEGSDYVKAEARKLADNVEELIKRELGQIVPIEIKDAPRFTATSITSIGISRGELVTEAADDDCPF
jgi:CO dehydrogenase/acetyl-CoA synthase alpha subunit